MPEQKPGEVGWFDLTVPDADEIRNFYATVVGWQTEAHSMGDYSDYVLKTAGGDAIGGICHARGANAEIPAQWLIYITVEDLNTSVEQVQTLGGEIVCPPRSMGGYGTMAVIRDPAGAVAALIQPAGSDQ